MKKYRIKRVSEYSSINLKIRNLYYPQVRKFGIWFYMYDNKYDREAICFGIEANAWDHIDKISSYEKVEYLYERKRNEKVSECS